jgi:hypothetical protein
MSYYGLFKITKGWRVRECDRFGRFRRGTRPIGPVYRTRDCAKSALLTLMALDTAAGVSSEWVVDPVLQHIRRGG